MQFHHLLDYCVKQLGAGEQVNLNRLQGGTINHNYCLQIDAQKYLVKHFVGNRWLPVKRDALFALQQKLAEVNIAASPIHLSDKQDVYIEQWLDFSVNKEGASFLSNTQALSGVFANVETSINTLAQALHHIHECPVETDTIDLVAHWKRYLKYVQDPQKKWYKKLQEYTKIWRDYERRYGDDFVLCHNDLQLEHVLVGQNKYIDWEYAARGCRFFDLIACILANQFTQKDANLLIMRYIELSDFHREEVLQRTKTLQVLVIFTHQLWWQANEYHQNRQLNKQK
jgi:thiamine kinase-like enzyme